MKKQNLALIYAVISIFAVTNSQAQTTGNYLYNDNNRFRNNWSYQGLSNVGATSLNNFQVNNTHSAFGACNSNSMSINILFNAQPTSYLAIFHINQAADSVKLADKLINERYKKFVTTCNKLGIESKDIFMDMIALVPIYEKEKNKKMFSKNNNEKPVGVEVQKNIHIRYKSASLLDQIFTAAAESEIYDLIKVEYFSDSTDKIMEQINAKAFSIYNKKLEFYKKLGINYDTCFRQFSETKNAFFPIDQYTSYKPLAVSRVQFKSSDAATETNVAYPESTTVFYNQLAQKGYDAIMNPNTNGEPKIQFVYNLTISFTRNLPVLYKEGKAGKNTSSTFVITPQGTLLQVPQ